MSESRARYLVPLLLLAACTKGADPAGSEPPMVKSALVRNTQPSVPQADADTLREGDTAFAADLYKTLSADPASHGENLFFSPHSISTALAMTYAGAHGETATQMAAALDFTLPPDRLAAAFDALDLALSAPPQRSDDFTLRTVDSMWGAPGTTFVPTFLDTLAVDYGTGIRLTDFANPDQATSAINQWVSRETEQKIADLIPRGALDPLTRFVLVNAVYFKARWSIPFENAQPGTFHGASGDTPASLMHGEHELGYGEAADQSWAAASIPYVGGCTMTVVVPKDISVFEGTLSQASLDAVVSSLAPAEVNLTLPKFTIPGASFSLARALRARGMTNAFGDGADFSGISATEHLFLKDVLHEAFISVDEQGTEAAAATAVIGEATSALSRQGTLTADRPFVFFIREPKTGAILFLGRVLEV